MALGTTVYAANSKGATGQAMNLLQHSSQWVTAIEAGGVDDADNAGSTILNPTTTIVTSNRKIIATGGAGTLMLIRLRYINGDTVTTDPVVQVFGRSTSSEAWMALRNKANSETISFATEAASDVVTTLPDTLIYSVSAVDLDDHYIDLAGCSEVLVGVKTAIAATAGAFAVIEVKII